MSREDTRALARVSVVFMCVCVETYIRASFKRPNIFSRVKIVDRGG